MTEHRLEGTRVSLPRAGGREVLKLTPFNPRSPGPGEALVRVRPGRADDIAATLTAGDVCVDPVLVKVKLTSHAVPAVVLPDAAVSTSCPLLCVHAPVVPRSPLLDVTLRLVLSDVCDPVSPEIVTVEPTAMS